MQIILVFPESEEKRRELSRLAAEIHARAVIRRLNLLSCPVSEKLPLLEKTEDAARRATPSA